MAFELNDSQKAELAKLIKFIKNMESIVRTTPSEEQRARVQKELGKYRAKVTALVPGFDASRKSADQITQELKLAGGTAAAGATDTAATSGGGAGSASGSGSPYKVLDRYEFGRASEHSNDPDINFLSGILQLIEKEYWPALTDSHCKLDFSNAAERDGVRLSLDNILRNLSVLVETVEEYATAEKQDFREQLLKMKNRQTRTFIYDANEALKKIRDFVRKLATDLEQGGGMVMNKDEIIRFNPRYEAATQLGGQTVQSAILEFRELIQEALEHLNLPQMKIRQSPHG